MIEILGANEGQEYEAALHLRKALLAVWPDLSQHREDHIKIFVGLKLYGQQYEDIDVLLIGQFSEPRRFDVELKFYPRNGEPFAPRAAFAKNFAFAIEVKSHDANGVKFNDKVASVRYPRGWECVTEKAFKQVFELKTYLERSGFSPPYIQDLVFFSGLTESDLPQRPHNCFGIDAGFEKILNIAGQVSQPVAKDRYATISFGPSQKFTSILAPDAQVLSTLEPTPIDRRKMDRIIKSAVPQEWLEDIGTKQVVMRGRGGVGKTVMLLQMAYRAFDSKGMRSLLLTYNKALVADMRRTMALLGVPRQIEKGGISIETVHAFVARLMRELGILNTDTRFLENYEKHKEALLEYLRSGAVSKDDLAALIEEQADAFSWDIIFVDEGQDWPSNEIEILRTIYAPEQIVVADGVDQYVRASVADWDVGLPREKKGSRRLTRCLRMKANLAHFVADCANELGLENWDLEPNPEANGGRVIIVEGDMVHDSAVFEQVRLEAAGLGNHPIDLLACVPPSLVVHEEDHAYSHPGSALVASGQSVWDATSIDVRDYYPTERDALRIVQYDSCRGLEGWAVLNYAFDDLFDYKYRQWLEAEHDTEDRFETVEELARAFASQWIMIPLTRAMDTLVINISRRESILKDVLRTVCDRRRDFVDWQVLD